MTFRDVNRGPPGSGLLYEELQVVLASLTEALQKPCLAFITQSETLFARETSEAGCSRL